MSRKKNDVFSEVVVGLFMLAVLSLLVYFTIIISGVDVLQGRSKVFANVTFNDVGGLKDSDSVMYRGTKVGVVDRINLSPTNLTVVIEIDHDVVLRDTYRIAVCNLSMLGGNYLLLEEGEGNVLPLETTSFKGEQPTDWMRDVAKIAKNLNDLTSGGEIKGIITNLEVTSEKVREVVDRVERGEGTIGKLLSSDETIYNDIAGAVADVKSAMSRVGTVVDNANNFVADAHSIIDNVNTVLTNANTVVERVRDGEGTIGKLLSSDDTVYNDLKKTLANASDISERIAKGEGLIGRLLKDDDPLYGKVEEALASFKKACDSLDARSTIEAANTLLANLNEVAERIKKPEGTIGKLVNSSELYDEVEGLTKDVRQVIDNFRDTTPITTFGSLIMGGL